VCGGLHLDLSVQQSSGACAQLPMERTARHLQRVVHTTRSMAVPNMVPEQDLRQRRSGRARDRKLRPGFNVQHPRRAHRHQDGESRADVELLGWPVRLPVVPDIRRGASGEPVPTSVQRNLARSRLHLRPLTLDSPEFPVVDPSSGGAPCRSSNKARHSRAQVVAAEKAGCSTGAGATALVSISSPSLITRLSSLPPRAPQRD
jgi:hypothetical protein